MNYIALHNVGIFLKNLSGLTHHFYPVLDSNFHSVEFFGKKFISFINTSFYTLNREIEVIAHSILLSAILRVFFSFQQIFSNSFLIYHWTVLFLTCDFFYYELLHPTKLYNYYFLVLK